MQWEKGRVKFEMRQGKKIATECTFKDRRKFEKTNLRKIWAEYWDDIYNNRWDNVKKRIIEEYVNDISEAMGQDTDVLTAAKQYMNINKGHDTLFEHINGTGDVTTDTRIDCILHF